MWIKNNDDIKRFEETISKCKESVWVITDSGKEYDLKETRGHYLGLASMLAANGRNEPEIYANSTEDQQLLFGYLSQAC